MVVHEDLTGLLAHDLKTPLAAIAMNLDYVLSEMDPNSADALRSALEDCRQANARAIRIVSDMADVARLAVGDYRPTLCEFCPVGIIERVANAAAEEAATREVRIVWSSTKDPVTAEPELLARVLDRLVERALRYARPGSALAIDHRAQTVSVHAETATVYRGESPSRALATHFAEAAIQALGGTLDTETDGKRGLVYRVTLLTP
jgi:K+-sensing histidine kinase KdpD